MSTAYTKANDFGVFSAARAQAAKMEQYLTSPAALGAEHGELESYIAEQGREYQRLLLQAHFDLRAALEKRVQVQGADGVRRGYARASGRPLSSVFGLCWITRLAYQRDGVDGLHPQDALLNLPEELYSHGLRLLVAQEAANNSFELTQQTIYKRTGVLLGNRQLEELAARAVLDFDGFYANRGIEGESDNDLMVLTFDGKGIVVRTEDLREPTRRAAESNKNKLSKRLSSGEKKNHKRMAEVASVYSLKPASRTPQDVLYDLGYLKDGRVPERPRPTNKRVWASVKLEMKQVIWQAFEEALKRDPERRRRWVAVVDGNPEQLKWIRWAARKAGVRITIILDIMHVLEYIWSAAWAFYSQGSPEAERWVHRRLLGLLQGRSGGELARSMRKLADERSLSTKARKPVEACAKYLVKYTRHLHYDRALAAGMPLATGVVEGACRHLVKRRMDAARWSLDGAEAVVRSRALVLSGDLEQYWEFHLRREHERNHLSRYAGNVIPMADFLPKRRANLEKAA
jgi:hypothetical protein